MWAHKDGGKSFDKMTYLMPIHAKLIHDRFGANLRMTELQGAIATLTLNHGWDRDAIVEELEELGVPCYSAKYEEAYHQTVVKSASAMLSEITSALPFA